MKSLTILKIKNRITDITPNYYQQLSDELDKTYINTQEVLNIADKLYSINKNIVDSFGNLDREMKSLENCWTSVGYQRTIAAFSIIKDHLNTRNTQMNSYIDFIKKVVVTGYEESENTNTSLADAFK